MTETVKNEGIYHEISTLKYENSTIYGQYTQSLCGSLNKHNVPEYVGASSEFKQDN